MAFEFVLIAAVAVLSLQNKLASFRTGLVGLAAVATILYIDACNTFLAVQSKDYYEDAPELHRVRTVTAGAIMTAVANGFLILGMGMTDAEPVPAVSASKAEATTAV